MLRYTQLEVCVDNNLTKWYTYQRFSLCIHNGAIFIPFRCNKFSWAFCTMTPTLWYRWNFDWLSRPWQKCPLSPSEEISSTPNIAHIIHLSINFDDWSNWMWLFHCTLFPLCHLINNHFGWKPTVSIKFCWKWIHGSANDRRILWNDFWAQHSLADWH